MVLDQKKVPHNTHKKPSDNRRSDGTVPEFNTATLLFRRIRIGGVSVGDYTAREAQVAWKEIVSRLNTIGHRPLVDSIIPFEEVKMGFSRLAQGPMGKVVVRLADQSKSARS